MFALTFSLTDIPLNIYLAIGGLLLVVILLLVALYYGGYMTVDNLKWWAAELILEAEEHLNTATGKERLNHVVTILYTSLPKSLQTIFTIARIETLVQGVFDEMAKVIRDSEGKTHVIPQDIRK